MSTNSWLPPGFARLERVRGRGRVASGSPAVLLLEWAGDIRDMKTIPAILALVHRWMPLPRAKYAIEAMVADRTVRVYVPKIESLEALAQELVQTGVKATALPHGGIDIAARRMKLDLTQEHFAVRYGLDVDAVRDWEAGRRVPGSAARSYPQAIRADPQTVEQALWAQPIQLDAPGKHETQATGQRPAH
jgi:putative transcriptional regulator